MGAAGSGQDRKPGAPENTGEFHDRFGNKITMYGVGNGMNGYGIVLFDTTNREIEMQFHPLSKERKTDQDGCFGLAAYCEVLVIEKPPSTVEPPRLTICQDRPC